MKVNPFEDTPEEKNQKIFDTAKSSVSGCVSSYSYFGIDFTGPAFS